MIEPARYRPHPEEPARASLRPVNAETGPWAGRSTQRFDVVSRGDFVPGNLYLPDSGVPTPAPLLLLQHGASEGKDSAALDCAAPWVGAGLAVAKIDLPLHGERSSAKLSERLISGLRQFSDGVEPDAETRVLVEEFSSQALSDLIRTLDALCALPEIDGDRVGFLGLGLGAIVGTDLLANDSRTRIAVFAEDNDGLGASDTLPELPQESSELLHVSTDSGAFSEEAIAEIWGALCKKLGL